MRTVTALRDQHFPALLDTASGDVRVLDAADLLRAWAARLLEQGSYSRRERQALYDIARPHRESAINRSAFARVWELAPLAALEAATWGPTRIKVEIVGRSNIALVSEDAAHTIEEDANRDGNLAQYRRSEVKSRSTALDLMDAMHAQALASEQLALAAMSRR